MKKRGRNIFLIGFMGSGKTSVGRELAEKLRAEFLDTDEMIEAREGMSIRDIFGRFGEERFRDMETDLLREMRAGAEGTRVISVGGGLPVREINRALMREAGITVFLTASEDTLAARLAGDTGRPLLQGTDLRERIRTLSKERLDKYLDASDDQVCVDEGTPAQIAERIIALLPELESHCPEDDEEHDAATRDDW